MKWSCGMAKRSNLPAPALRSGRSPGGRRTRDPLTRLLFFCQLMGLGLVAASLYLPFPGDLNRPGRPVVSLDVFPTYTEKAAILAIHTRTTWVVLAILGLLTALIAYATRRATKRSRLVACAPLFLLLIVAAHTAAQVWLQSRGVLYVEISGKSDVMHLSVLEGTKTQWKLPIGGDLLFSVPLLFAWVLGFTRGKWPEPPAKR
jgi:hypothetical protein